MLKVLVKVVLGGVVYGLGLGVMGLPGVVVYVFMLCGYVPFGVGVLLYHRG